jgi:hypothetical protein
MGPNGPPGYPQPWARVAETSFLSEPEQVSADAIAAGFDIVSFTPASGDRGRTAAAGAQPALGIHVLMGPFIHEARRNGVRDSADGRMGTVKCLLQKPK